VKQDEEMKFIATTEIKVHYVHNTVSFLQQIESFFIHFSLNKLNARVIQFSKYDRYLILGHPQFFVVVFIKCIIFIEGT
jgi:hypothetical protein